MKIIEIKHACWARLHFAHSARPEALHWLPTSACFSICYFYVIPRLFFKHKPQMQWPLLHLFIHHFFNWRTLALASFQTFLGTLCTWNRLALIYTYSLCSSSPWIYTYSFKRNSFTFKMIRSGFRVLLLLSCCGKVHAETWWRKVYETDRGNKD